MQLYSLVIFLFYPNALTMVYCNDDGVVEEEEHHNISVIQRLDAAYCSITRHLPAYYKLMTLHLQNRDIGSGTNTALTLIFPSIWDICNEWPGGRVGGWCGNTCSRCVNSSVSCVLPNYNYHHHRPPAHQPPAPALPTAHGHCHKLDQCKSINN